VARAEAIDSGNAIGCSLCGLLHAQQCSRDRLHKLLVEHGICARRLCFSRDKCLSSYRYEYYTYLLPVGVEELGEVLTCTVLFN